MLAGAGAESAAAASPAPAASARYADTAEYRARRAAFEREPARPGAVVFLGDSLTAGGNWDARWPAAARPVLNRGLPGDRVRDVAARVREVARHRPAAVFLMAGINDLVFERRGADAVARDLEALVRRLRAQCPTATIFVQSVLPASAAVAADVRRLNGRLARAAPRLGARYVDLYPAMASPGGALRDGLSADGLHLAPAAYALWAGAVGPLVDGER